MRDNGIMSRRGLCLVVSLVVAIAVARPAGAQAPRPDPQTAPPTQTATPGQATPPSQTTTAETTTQPALPVDVDKIRTALSRPQSLQINNQNQNLRFYLEIHPAPVTFMSWVGNFDLMKGPVPGSAISGVDLANMMTPREMYSSAGITATDMLQFAATNFAAQSLIRRAVTEIRNAKDQKQVAEIQAKIDHELAVLMAKDDKTSKNK
jgi:hypothetical protein